jgi:hypothetical protein
VEDYLSVATSLAHAAIRAQREALAERGIELRVAGILESSGRRQIPLSAVLASHALIHAADGDHFRQALSAAAGQHRLQVCRLPARALETHAAERLRRPINRLLDAVNDLGRSVGPPWGADQKKAALLAWCLLADGRR